jgi:hypothetical protein
MMMKKIAITAVFGFLILAVSVWAQAPNLVNYQGVLKDSGGNPLTGTYSITFSLYSVSSGGTALWTETQGSVSVSNGLFSVLLGSVTPLTPSEFSGTNRWLGVTVGGDPEMTPRQRIASVPFALKTPAPPGKPWFLAAGASGTDWVGCGAATWCYTTGLTAIGPSAANYNPTDGRFTAPEAGLYQCFVKHYKSYSSAGYYHVISTCFGGASSICNGFSSYDYTLSGQGQTGYDDSTGFSSGFFNLGTGEQIAWRQYHQSATSYAYYRPYTRMGCVKLSD